MVVGAGVVEETVLEIAVEVGAEIAVGGGKGKSWKGIVSAETFVFPSRAHNVVLIHYRSSSFEKHKQKERGQRSGRVDEPDAPPEEGRASDSPVEFAEPPPPQETTGGGEGKEW